jgi:hypothetical protein
MLVSTCLIEIHERIFAGIYAAKLCTISIVFASSSAADQEHLSEVTPLQTALASSTLGFSSRGWRHIPD